MISGLFLFNKPSGVSSADFLNRLKSFLARANQDQSSERLKIGHGGTLDPFASGLLVVGVGREYTKQLHDILKNTNKKYLAEIILGAGSDTYDRTGKIFNVSLDEKILGDSFFDYSPTLYFMRRSSHKIKCCPDVVREAIEKLKKQKTQTVPKFSAVKIKGVPAYKMAREGKEVRVKGKEVSLIDYKIISVNRSEDKIILEIELEVSAGFYIRSFAHDLGVALGSDGYVNKLERQRIGEFDLKRALEPGDLDQKIELYFRASGDVQRIGFRYFASKIALELNITGFARNLAPISIEVVGQGKLGVLERFLDVLKKGPDTAKIESFSAYFRKPEVNFSNFTVSE